MSNNPRKPDKIQGLAHLFAAACYSIAGARRLWRETAFRHQLLMGLFIVAILIWIGAETTHIGISMLLLGLTIVTEAVSYTHLTLPTN